MKEENKISIEELEIVDDTPVSEFVEYDPLDELLENDFTDEENDFNLDDSYKLIENIKAERVNLKKNEAETVLLEVGPEYLEKEFQSEMDRIKNNFYAFVKKYDVNSDNIKEIETKGEQGEREKDKIYGIAQFLKNNYIDMVNNLMFDMKFTRDEYNFMEIALRRKIEYDGNEVFNLIDLKQTYLDKWQQSFRVMDKMENEFTVTIDIKNIVMLYHFLQKHTVKGIDKSFENFVGVLGKIGDTNRIYNAYNVVKDRIETDFITWAGSITANVTGESNIEIPTEIPTEKE